MSKIGATKIFKFLQISLPWLRRTCDRCPEFHSSIRKRVDRTGLAKCMKSWEWGEDAWPTTNKEPDQQSQNSQKSSSLTVPFSSLIFKPANETLTPILVLCSLLCLMLFFSSNIAVWHISSPRAPSTSLMPMSFPRNCSPSPSKWKTSKVLEAERKDQISWNNPIKNDVGFSQQILRVVSWTWKNSER